MFNNVFRKRTDSKNGRRFNVYPIPLNLEKSIPSENDLEFRLREMKNKEYSDGNEGTDRESLE